MLQVYYERKQETIILCTYILPSSSSFFGYPFTVSVAVSLSLFLSYSLTLFLILCVSYPLPLSLGDTVVNMKQMMYLSRY